MNLQAMALTDTISSEAAMLFQTEFPYNFVSGHDLRRNTGCMNRVDGKDHVQPLLQQTKPTVGEENLWISTSMSSGTR